MLAALALAAPAVAAAPKTFKVALTAPTHTPKVNVHWPYVDQGDRRSGARRSRGRSAVAVVDPIGGVHPVQYSCCKTKYVTNVPIKGVFRDYVIWPARVGDRAVRSSSG